MIESRASVTSSTLELASAYRARVLSGSFQRQVSSGDYISLIGMFQPFGRSEGDPKCRVDGFRSNYRTRRSPTLARNTTHESGVILISNYST